MKTVDFTRLLNGFILAALINVAGIATAQTTYLGLRVPQLTTLDRDKINPVANDSNAKGLQIFNLTTGQMEFWNGTKWSPVLTTAENGLTATGATLKLGGVLNQTTTIDLSGYNLIFSGNSGRIGIGATAPSATLHVEGDVRITDTPISTNSHDQYLVVDNDGKVLARPSVLSRIGGELSLNQVTNWSNTSHENIMDFYFIDREHTLTLPAMPNNDFKGKVIRFYIYGGNSPKVVINGVYYNPNYTAFPADFAYSGNTLTITGESNRFRFIDIISNGTSWFVNNK